MRLGDRGNKYLKISKEQRLKILQLVLTHKKTIKKAAEIVGVGSSTARMILRKYENSGTVFEPKAQRKKSNEQEPEYKVANEAQIFNDQENQHKDLNECQSSLFYLVVYQPQMNPYFYSYVE